MVIFLASDIQSPGIWKQLGAQTEDLLMSNSRTEMDFSHRQYRLADLYSRIQVLPGI